MVKSSKLTGNSKKSDIIPDQPLAIKENLDIKVRVLDALSKRLKGISKDVKALLKQLKANS